MNSNTTFLIETSKVAMAMVDKPEITLIIRIKRTLNTTMFLIQRIGKPIICKRLISILEFYGVASKISVNFSTKIDLLKWKFAQSLTDQEL